MTFNAECSRLRLAALVIVTSLLSASATVSSESVVGGCPPVVAYSPAEQARVASEVAALPESALIVGWLADYTAPRDQVRSCR